jgi:iron(III) transport system ATP-binding protein
MIELVGVSKHYGSACGLDSVSLTLPRGSTTVISGPSGSGKTTLLRLIAGLERPSEGEIHIDGALASKPAWVRPPQERNVGLVFQDAALWPHLTVTQNVAFGLLGQPRQEIARRVERMLSAMDLTGFEKRYPNQLSGGEARRVAIARTLIVNPRYLLLDEPLIHLQPALKLRLLEGIREQASARDITLLYVSHDLEEGRRLGGRMLKMAGGCIIPDVGAEHPSRDSV